jgi:hypothetical protein
MTVTESPPQRLLTVVGVRRHGDVTLVEILPLLMLSLGDLPTSKMIGERTGKSCQKRIEYIHSGSSHFVNLSSPLSGTDGVLGLADE